MNPYKRLGIAQNASVLEIKRAYARQLKSTRPDEDPIAFQALHEAYTYCLDNVGNDAVEEETVEEIEDASPYQEAEQLLADPPQIERLDVVQTIEDNVDDETFLDDFINRFAQDTPSEMVRWLNAHPAMFSIARKDAMRWDILDQMEQVYPPVSIEMMEVVKQFFGLDQVDFKAPWLIDRLTALEHDFDGARAYNALHAEFSDPHTRYFDRLIYRELSTPFHFWRRAFFMLMFGMPRRILELWQKFDAADPNAAQTHLDAASVSFWRAVAVRKKITLPRLAVAASRICFWVPLASFPAFKDANLVTFVSPAFWKTIVGNMGVWATLWLAVCLVNMAAVALRDRLQRTK